MAEKLGGPIFINLDHFSEILVQVGLNFLKNWSWTKTYLKILVWDQHLCENFGPGPKLLPHQNFSNNP